MIEYSCTFGPTVTVTVDQRLITFTRRPLLTSDHNCNHVQSDHVDCNHGCSNHNCNCDCSCNCDLPRPELTTSNPDHVTNHADDYGEVTCRLLPCLGVGENLPPAATCAGKKPLVATCAKISPSRRHPLLDGEGGKVSCLLPKKVRVRFSSLSAHSGSGGCRILSP